MLEVCQRNPQCSMQSWCLEFMFWDSFGTWDTTLVLFYCLVCSTLFSREKHPGNLILLVLFMICISFALGLACSSKSGKFILEAVVLMAIVVVGLTPCTFWAAKRGHNFNFLGPFLFAAILVLMVYCLLLIFLPPGRVGKIIYCCIAAIVCSGFIVYDTDNLIKHYTYDEHIITSISLYLDIANLFSALLNLPS